MTREISPIKMIGREIRNFGPGTLPADAPDPEAAAEPEVEEEVQESPDPKAENPSGSATQPAASSEKTSSNPETVPTESETPARPSVDEETSEKNGSLLSLVDPNLG